MLCVSIQTWGEKRLASMDTRIFRISRLNLEQRFDSVAMRSTMKTDKVDSIPGYSFTEQCSSSPRVSLVVTVATTAFSFTASPRHPGGASMEPGPSRCSGSAELPSGGGHHHRRGLRRRAGAGHAGALRGLGSGRHGAACTNWLTTYHV